jgi:hypothetical protein
MLKFTAHQELAVNAARAGFNTRQVALAAAHGYADQFGDDLTGNAAVVPLDAWRRIDSRASVIQRDVLAVFNRLSAANTTPVNIGDLVSYFPKVSDSGEVHVSMDGRSEGRQDQAVVKYEGTPIPILDSYARFGWRQMAVMMKGSTGLDTVTIANHQRKVAEKMEDMVLNGLSSVAVGGSTIYGLRNFPNRTSGTHGFTLTTATGANWLAAVSAVVQGLIGDNSFGRATLFVNYADYTAADLNEFVAGYPKTILQRLLEVKSVAEIVPCSKVPTGDIIAVQNIDSGEWGSILSAMPMVTKPKVRINTEDDYVFGVMAAVAPQFRSDYGDRSHIAHWTTA